MLIVEVKTVLKLERARTALRNFVIKHLSKFEKDYALVAFYSKEDNGADWRFSFIKLEYRSELDEAKGKVKTRKEFTPAKRYSFLVGKYEKAHTAKNQLLPLLQNIANNPTIEELEAAFSIEKVTENSSINTKICTSSFSSILKMTTTLKPNWKKQKLTMPDLPKNYWDKSYFFTSCRKKAGWAFLKTNVGEKEKNVLFKNCMNKLKPKMSNFFKEKLQYLFYEALAKERNNVNSYYEAF